MIVILLYSLRLCFCLSESLDRKQQKCFLKSKDPFIRNTEGLVLYWWPTSNIKSYQNTSLWTLTILGWPDLLKSEMKMRVLSCSTGDSKSHDDERDNQPSVPFAVSSYRHSFGSSSRMRTRRVRKDSQLSQFYLKIAASLLIELLWIRCCLGKFYRCFAFGKPTSKNYSRPSNCPAFQIFSQTSMTDG